MSVRALFALVFLALSPALASGAAAQNLFSVGGEETDDPSPHSEASLVADVQAVAPGEPFTVGLRIGMDPHWHSYWTNPGDAGMPTRIDWTLPDGFSASDFSWPYPKRIAVEPLMSYAYEDEVVLLMEVTPPDAISGSSVTFEGKATWLICEEICLPAEEEVSLTLPVATAGALAQHDPVGGALIDRYRARVPVDSPAWAHAARRTDGGFDLLLQPGPDAETAALDGAYFFVSTGQTLDHAAEQTLRQTDEGYALALTGSDYAAGPTERLTGILVAPEGQTLDGTNRAIRIDAPVVDSLDAAPTEGESGGVGLWGAIGLAFLGGIMLNLMPCVFPILSIKILGFAQSASDAPAVQRKLGWAFAGGVLVSFWALAGLLLALRVAGEGIGWGFQLQSPVFVGAMALLMFGLGLNLLGVFEIGMGVSGRAAQLDRHEGLAGAFGSGALATLVATPCTAPLMGAALGWALVQPAAVALAVFTALGVGMALPYVALTHAPALAAKLPRPGPWMVRLKQALAFPLFATAVWLTWVFALQSGVDSAALLLGAMLALAFAGWVVHAWPAHGMSVRTRAVTRTLAGVGVLSALALVVLGANQSDPAAASDPSMEADWQPYSAAAVEAAREAGQPVFVDFTAAWCLTCQVNKRVALHTETASQAFERQNVARFRADWTNRDPAITEALADLGRSGVPVYAYYPAGSDAPTLLPEVLTPQLVVDALESDSSPFAQR
jgi:thiol:disulfide interchange protein DsbD